MLTLATAGVAWLSWLYSPFDIFLHLGESFRNNWPLLCMHGLCSSRGWGRDAPCRAVAREAQNLWPRGWRGMIGWEAEPSSPAQEPVWFRNTLRKTLAGRGAILSIDDAVSWPCRRWKQLEMLSAGAWEILGSLTPVQKGLSLAAGGTFGLHCVQRYWDAYWRRGEKFPFTHTARSYCYLFHIFTREIGPESGSRIRTRGKCERGEA